MNMSTTHVHVMYTTRVHVMYITHVHAMYTTHVRVMYTTHGRQDSINQSIHRIDQLKGSLLQLSINFCLGKICKFVVTRDSV